jgi:hypothetical protein
MRGGFALPLFNWVLRGVEDCKNDHLCLSPGLI